MKINQFGLLETSREQKESELKDLGFLDENWEKKTLLQLWQCFLEKSHPEVQNKNAKLKTLMATHDANVATFLASGKPLTQEVFARVGLQLLGFIESVDYEADHIQKFIETTNLSFQYGMPLETNIDLIHAWYNFLAIHTKSGLMFIDFLGSKGFFREFTNTHLFFNGKALPVFDTFELIREVVYVETDEDTDEDGWNDLVKVEIIRPKTTQPIPALFTASPYNQGVMNAVADKGLHDVSGGVQKKSWSKKTVQLPNRVQGKVRTPSTEEGESEETFTQALEYSLNSHMLSRGFASIYSTGIGGMESEGIMPCGEASQVASFKAVIEWLTGDRVGYTNKSDNIPMKANWCNGKIAMTGKSYLGTMATAVATTGVEGLELIISEAAISNWYHYYRENGLVIAPGGYQGEDCDVLSALTFSRRKQAGDYYASRLAFKKSLTLLQKNQERETGDYNAFWESLNYLKDVGGIKCKAVLVHGLNDWNVKPKHVFELHQAMLKQGVQHKMILHQGEHIYINNNRSLDFTDMMNALLTESLLEQPSRSFEQLPQILVQDNVQAETWHVERGWGLDTPSELSLHDNTSGKQSFLDAYSKDVAADFSKNPHSFSEEIVKAESSKTNDQRVFLALPAFDKEVYLDGVPELQLRVKSNTDYGFLSARLVDLGEAKRLKKVPTLTGETIDRGFGFKEEGVKEILLDSPTSEKMIAIGHTHLQTEKSTVVEKEVYTDISLKLQPTKYRLPKGRKLAVVIYATDFDFTLRGTQPIEYTFDFDKSQLLIPIRKVEHED
ncbi:MAG: Xaa-Pro dipeptidyl-peptidase [Streptococcaceae bacterium]|jgi:X-Pro dipeptidyl-peptidase|nr:Xaa-Pro dipeptidyl-peptidase [Streptococcaceae bacterium]